MMAKKTSMAMALSTQEKLILREEKIQAMKTTTAFKIGKKTFHAPYGMLQTLILVV